MTLNDVSLRSLHVYTYCIVYTLEISRFAGSDDYHISFEITKDLVLIFTKTMLTVLSALANSTVNINSKWYIL